MVHPSTYCAYACQWPPDVELYKMLCHTSSTQTWNCMQIGKQASASFSLTADCRATPTHAAAATFTGKPFHSAMGQSGRISHPPIVSICVH